LKRILASVNKAVSRAQELFGKLTKTSRIDDPGFVVDIKREALRLKKLRGIATSLKRSKNVQNRMLKTWLTTDEYREFEQEWRSQREIRSDLTEKPECLDRYEALLKKAIFFCNRAEGKRTKRIAATAKRLGALSVQYCEQAIECVRELYEDDISIQAWFDRPLAFGAGTAISANVESLPRMVTSRSHERLSDHQALMRKREVKLDVVERAIAGLEASLSEYSKHAAVKQTDRKGVADAVYKKRKTYRDL
jgi:hypothetical protein